MRKKAVYEILVYIIVNMIIIQKILYYNPILSGEDETSSYTAKTVCHLKILLLLPVLTIYI